MKIKIRFTEGRPIKKSKTQVNVKKGMWLDGKWFSVKRILRDKWLTKEEKDILLDMSGVSVKRAKSTRLSRKAYLNSRELVFPIARYYVDGVLYCDGSVDEISEFYGLS